MAINCSHSYTWDIRTYGVRSTPLHIFCQTHSFSRACNQIYQDEKIPRIVCDVCSSVTGYFSLMFENLNLKYAFMTLKWDEQIKDVA